MSACSSVFYFPEKQVDEVPSDKGYSYKSVYLDVEDGVKIESWLIPAKTEQRKGAVIYFHGNSLNMGHHYKQVSWLANNGYDLYMIDYRGFGNSGGSPNLKNSIADINLAIRSFLTIYNDGTPKFLVAQSLGASVAGHVLSTNAQMRKHFNGIVLDSPFSGWNKISRHVVGGGSAWSWFWDFPVTFFTPKDYDLIDVIENIAPTPLLIVHGRADRLVPFSHAEALYERAGEPKKLITYPNNHLRVFFEERARENVVVFINENATRPEREVAEAEVLARARKL